MILREYNKDDVYEMAELFYNTVHCINAADYTQQQIDAWADKNTDISKWHKIYSESYTIIAEEDNIITGFGNIYNNGYLDMLYVHKDHQGKKIASAICDKLESHYNVKNITVYSSLTAKTFFEKRGYIVYSNNTVKRNGIIIPNFIMKKTMVLK